MNLCGDDTGKDFSGFETVFPPTYQKQGRIVALRPVFVNFIIVFGAGMSGAPPLYLIMDPQGRFHVYTSLSAILVTLFILPVNGSDDNNLLGTLKKDYQRFYGQSSLKFLAGGAAAGAVMAESDVDRRLRSTISDLRGDRTNAFSRQSKLLGERPSALFFASLIPLSFARAGTPATLGQWSATNARAYLVGLPALWSAQVIIGAGRPEEGGSGWKPFKNSNGVSGHSFIGAVPFLSAARMSKNAALKTLFLTGSFAAGASRLNDDKHYASQVFLGWWLAYAAVDSVRPSKGSKSVQTVFISADLSDESTGILINWRF